MATDTSRLGLGALIVRAWRIKLAQGKRTDLVPNENQVGRPSNRRTNV
jgi:hypothetical protein